MAFSKINTSEITNHKLTGADIDQIAARIEEFLLSIKMERANVFRIRLSMEEALLRWQDRFGEDVSVRLELGIRWLRPTITLTLAGDGYDPLINAENELGSWANSLLNGVGLSPSYRYIRGYNIVQLKLKRPRINPALALLISGALGILIGVLGNTLLSEAIRDSLLHSVLDPVQSLFFRILNAAAGPVIFLTVLAAICGVGSVSAMNNSGRRLIIRFISICLIMALISAVIAGPFFRTRYLASPSSLDGEQVNTFLDSVFRIIPNDILSPFINGDSPQILLMALLIGNAVLVAGSQAGGLVSIIDQANTVGMLVAEWVSRLTPIFVTLLVILGIWNDSVSVFLGIWKPLCIFLILVLVMLSYYLIRVSKTKGVSIPTLINKIKTPFWIAFKNSSVTAAYGENQMCCERQLGIDHKLADFGLPLGFVIYMPTGTTATMVFCLYAAQSYGVNTSLGWYVTALFLTVIMVVATPPVAGMSILTYAACFPRLGIPIEALIVAMIADIIFNFVVSGVDQSLLQLELVLEADRLQMLDRNKLCKP